MTTIAFYAQFVGLKVGINSLTVTWDIERITRSDGTRLALVTGGATNVTVGRRGLYGYLLADADLSLYDYVATAITASSSVDQQEVAALWTRWTEDANPTGIRSAVGMAAANLDTQIAPLPTASEIDTALSATHGAGSWTDGGNGGSLSLVYTLTDSNTGLPVIGATVELYPTSAYSGAPIDTETTNALGQVTFANLVAGTYYIKSIRSGYEIGYDTEVVS